MVKKEVAVEMDKLDNIVNAEIASATRGDIKETHELAGAFEALDNDAVDPVSKRSRSDFIGNLTKDESLLIGIKRDLKLLGMESRKSDIAEALLRLSVSVGARGREDKVRIAQGVNENRQGEGFMSRFFGSKKQG